MRCGVTRLRSLPCRVSPGAAAVGHHVEARAVFEGRHEFLLSSQILIIDRVNFFRQRFTFRAATPPDGWILYAYLPSREKYLEGIMRR